MSRVIDITVHSKRRIVVKHDGSKYVYWNPFLGWRPLSCLSDDIKGGC